MLPIQWRQVDHEAVNKAFLHRVLRLSTCTTAPLDHDPTVLESHKPEAQGEVLHYDDTTAKILALLNERSPEVGLEEESEDDPERTGIFTSGVVSTREGRKIALFFTGNKHAGENLAEALAQRTSELGPPIQMCDALSRNLPKDFEVLLANRTAHGRRKVVEGASNFPKECRYVLETLADVYRNDVLAREQGMSLGERLAFHQERSGPRMDELESWLKEQIAEKKEGRAELRPRQGDLLHEEPLEEADAVPARAGSAPGQHDL